MVWLWDRFIPEGSLILLSAPPKVGKSTFAYELAMAHARGQKFLGYPMRRGRVLILAVEEHQRDVRLRLQGLGLTPKDRVRVWPRPLGPWMLTEVRRYIVAEEVTLVILDTLSSFWRPESENSNTEVHEWIERLRELARTTDAAVLVIHHDRKGGGQYGEQVRGGSALLAQVDQSLGLSRGQNLTKTQRLLKTEGRYLDTPRELLLDWTGQPPRFRSLGAPTATNIEQRKVRVLSALREGPKRASSDDPETTDTLEKLTALGPKPLKVVLSRLLADKAVSRSGSGKKGDPVVWSLVKKQAVPA